MGLIAQRFSEVRNDPGWLNRDDDIDGGSPNTSAGVRVNRNTALSLTTIWRCVDLLSSAVAQSPKDIVVKIGGRSFPEYAKPSWLVTPNPADPTYTADDYFSQVALSVLLDGNYFVRVFPYVLDPHALIVLDPQRVDVKAGPRYEIKDATGTVIERVGPMEMLHGTWLRPPGALRGISPLESLRRGIGSAIAAEDFGGRFFGQGASLAFGVEVPYQMDANKANDLRQSLRRKYAGANNSHAIGVLTDGAKFVSGLAPTPEQAQMLATRAFSVEDLCRPFGVPPAMAGSSEPGAASYASSKKHDDQFKERSVLPFAVRIEQQHNRLLSVPAGITDPTATVQFKFNLDGIGRVDILSRYQAYSAGVLGGILKPREAREKEDLPPLADNSDDQLFMQQQMVPIGKLGTQLAPPPPPAPPIRMLEPDL